MATGAGEYRFSALSGPKCSKTLTPPRPRPSTPNPAYCFSEEATNVGFVPTIQRQHMLCIPLHCRGRAGEYRFSALSGPKCSKTCTPPRPRPSTPNPAYCFSEKVTKVGPLPTIQTPHMLCIPLHCRGHAGGVQVFSIFRPQTFQNLYSPASAAQHPQPCLLLLRRSNESRFPSHQTKTAHDLYSPALPRARGSTGFQHFRPQMFQNLSSPASPAQHPQPCLLLLRRSNI